MQNSLRKFAQSYENVTILPIFTPFFSKWHYFGGLGTFLNILFVKFVKFVEGILAIIYPFTESKKYAKLPENFFSKFFVGTFITKFH